LTNTTYGLGDAIANALDEGCSELLVGIGGSVTTDGGTGAARAVGWRFLDRDGVPLRPGGGALVDLAVIKPPPNPLPANRKIVGLCDVTNVLLGPEGAARAFAPQKGASDADVEKLEKGLEVLAQRLKDDLDLDVTELEGGGAGGGTGAGLVAFFGATLRGGFEAIAATTDLESAIASADLVITGEGRLDRQSLDGKAPIGVSQIAMATKTKCLALAGEIALTKSTMSNYGISASLAIRDTGLEVREDLPMTEIVTRTTETLLRRVFEKTRTVRFARGPLGNRLPH
jgi:glycerate 2-kinase